MITINTREYYTRDPNTFKPLEPGLDLSFHRVNPENGRLLLPINLIEVISSTDTKLVEAAVNKGNPMYRAMYPGVDRATFERILEIKNVAGIGTVLDGDNRPTTYAPVFSQHDRLTGIAQSTIGHTSIPDIDEESFTPVLGDGETMVPFGLVRGNDGVLYEDPDVRWTESGGRIVDQNPVIPTTFELFVIPGRQKEIQPASPKTNMWDNLVTDNSSHTVRRGGPAGRVTVGLMKPVTLRDNENPPVPQIISARFGLVHGPLNALERPDFIHRLAEELWK